MMQSKLKSELDRIMRNTQKDCITGDVTISVKIKDGHFSVIEVEEILNDKVLLEVTNDFNS